jgi:hypothetical protein
MGEQRQTLQRSAAKGRNSKRLSTALSECGIELELIGYELGKPGTPDAPERR